jgi:hypothetical protein
MAVKAESKRLGASVQYSADSILTDYGRIRAIRAAFAKHDE